MIIPPFTGAGRPAAILKQFQHMRAVEDLGPAAHFFHAADEPVQGENARESN